MQTLIKLFSKLIKYQALKNYQFYILDTQRVGVFINISMSRKSAFEMYESKTRLYIDNLAFTLSNPLPERDNFFLSEQC
jgi:hypothetical protein